MTFDLDKIMNIHQGARIAIFGSGPSLEDAVNNSDSYDIGIAVNSAVRKSGIKINYFLSNHAYAHSEERGWQNILGNYPEITILMNSSSAPYWELLYSNLEKRKELQKFHQDFLKNDKRTHPLNDGAYDDGKLINDYFFINENPNPPHIVYNKIPISTIEGNLLDEKDKIINGASSAGAAIHMAILMGAKELVLFGVQMTNNDGGNYDLPHNIAEKGRSSDKQRINLDRLFSEVYNIGIPITVYGKHTFEGKFLINK